MAHPASIPSNSLKHIEWMWKSNPDPWSKTQPEEWSHYSDVENLIIEEAFSAKQSKVLIDDYWIDFKHNVQISKCDPNKQRPLKRMARNREDKHLREARFVDAPIHGKCPFGGEYGWVSPFIIEVRRHLGLESKQLPSKDPSLIPMLVEKAARGIIEEGKQIGKQQEAEKLARMLMQKRDKGMKEVWQCCIYLYSMESFLYKKLNEAMRLVGDGGKENVWRNKVQTLGPFGLLIWDDPLNSQMKKNITLYRGAKLSEEQIAAFAKLAKNPKEYRSFQAFSSCSRDRQKAEEYGNALFIMRVFSAFIANISTWSEYADEEEELVTPGVSFSVQRVEFDQKTEKHLIYLKLKQRFSHEHRPREIRHPTGLSYHRPEKDRNGP